MGLFRLHLLTCSVCKHMPRVPCADGWRLLHDNAWILARTPDPKRAKA